MTVKTALLAAAEVTSENLAEVRLAKKMHELHSRIEVPELVERLRGKNETGVVKTLLLPELPLGVIGHTSDNRDRLAK